MLDVVTFDAGLAVFVAHFPQLKFIDHNADAWYTTVKNEVDPEMYKRAVIKACKLRKWFPSDNFAGAIIAAADELRAADCEAARLAMSETKQLQQPDDVPDTPEFRAARKGFVAAMKPDTGKDCLKEMAKYSAKAEEIINTREGR